MKRNVLFIVFSICICALSSCGSIVNGFVSLYGNENYDPYVAPGNGVANSYANFWNNASTSATSVPAALDPVNAANAAAATMNANLQNQMKVYWENAAKDEQQRSENDTNSKFSWKSACYP